MWPSVNKNVLFPDWCSYQPDNSYNEDCIQIWKRDAKWNDGKCEKTI